MGPNPIGLVSLKANELGHTHTHREDLMETVEEDGHLQSRRMPLRRNELCRHLEPGLPASRTMRR